MHQGWDAYEYSCYWMKEMPRCWLDAKQFCKAQDTDLVHIGDLWVKNRHMLKKIPDRTCYFLYFISTAVLA